MRIKVNSLSVIKGTDIGKKLNNKNAFKVKDMLISVDSKSLKNSAEDSDTLKCLKYCLKENNNIIDFNELRELVDTTNMIENNFWSEDEFIKSCRFEYRDLFDFNICKFIYF